MVKNVAFEMIDPCKYDEPPTYQQAIAKTPELECKPSVNTHNCQGYSINFQPNGILSKVLKIFFGIQYQCKATFECGLKPTLSCEPGESKDVTISVSINGQTKNISLRITQINDEHSKCYCEYRVKLLSRQTWLQRAIGFNDSLIMALQRKLSLRDLQGGLLDCYTKTYANKDAFECFNKIAAINFHEESKYNGVSLLEIFRGKYTQLVEHLAFDSDKAKFIKEKYQDSEGIMCVLIAEYFKDNQLTWQQFFDVLSTFPDIESEPEFHRAARMFNVKLPSHWKPCDDLPVSSRPINLLKINRVDRSNPNSESNGGNDIGLLDHLSNHCLSLGLTLGLSMNEIEICQSKCYGTPSRGQHFNGWNRWLVIRILEFYRNKQQLTWEGLFRNLDTIPEISELEDYRDFKFLFTSEQCPYKGQNEKCSLVEIEPDQQIALRDCHKLSVNGQQFNLFKALYKYETFDKLCEYFQIDKTNLWHLELPQRIDEQAIARLIEIKCDEDKFTWKMLGQALIDLGIDKQNEEISDFCRLCTQ